MLGSEVFFRGSILKSYLIIPAMMITTITYSQELDDIYISMLESGISYNASYLESREVEGVLGKEIQESTKFFMVQIEKVKKGVPFKVEEVEYLPSILLKNFNVNPKNPSRLGQEVIEYSKGLKDTLKPYIKKLHHLKEVGNVL